MDNAKIDNSAREPLCERPLMATLTDHANSVSQRIELAAARVGILLDQASSSANRIRGVAPPTPKPPEEAPTRGETAMDGMCGEISKTLASADINLYHLDQQIELLAYQIGRFEAVA